MRFAPLAVALMLAVPAVAQDYDVDVGPDAVTIDPAAKPAHRRGRRLVSGEVVLARPIVDSGRVVDRMSVTQEWDCKAARYRTVRKTFRSDEGLFMHSDPRDGPWIPVAKDGPGWETLKRACPTRADDETPGQPTPRHGPQVVTLPPR